MPIYEYKCPEGHITELQRQMTFREQPTICECGKEAKYIVSAPTLPMDIMSDKWAKMHEKEAKRDNPNLRHV